MKRFWQLALLLFIALAQTACTISAARNPVPRELVEVAIIPELEQVRIWGDAPPDRIFELLKERQHQILRDRGGRRGDEAYLALSGGGGDGAFGAGLLTGWSARGDRPKFGIVTGVSTGALIAPFAFLGSEYDRQLVEFYTRYETKDLLRPRLIPALIGGAAAASSKPFAEIIEQYVDQNLLDAIAREHRKGRRLLVSTTNLDAQRLVIWDMGRIAASRHPDSLVLFQQVLRASASLPGVFPPVNIRVRAGGRFHEEMHVDGGVTHDLFFAPTQILQALSSVNGQSRNRLYVVFNSKLTPEWASVEQNARKIALRSISTLIKSHANADIANLHKNATKTGVQFNLASIPPEFDVESTELFDKAYMQELFALGQSMGRKGFPWAKTPPGHVR